MSGISADPFWQEKALVKEEKAGQSHQTLEHKEQQKQFTTQRFNQYAKKQIDEVLQSLNFWQLKKKDQIKFLWEINFQTPNITTKAPTTFSLNQYNSFTTPQGNIIWGGALNLAFNDFKRQFLSNKNLRLQGASDEVNKMLSTLNKSPFSKNNISENAIYVKSGVGKQIAQTINKEVLEKFPLKTTPALSTQQMKDDDFVSYAYLSKALVYQHQFERQPGILWFGTPQGTDPYMVEAFAAISDECLSQIKVIDFKGRKDFFVGFRAKLLEIKNDALDQQLKIDENKPWYTRFWDNLFSQKIQPFNDGKNADVIYLLSAKQDNQQTVGDIVKRVQQAQAQKSISERQSNKNLLQFSMPIIDLDLKHEYQQFRGLPVANKQLRGQKLKIIENLKLRMDQKGVVVENDAFMGKDECAIVGSIEINIQNPFWVVLTEQGKHPYLVAKINYLPEKHLEEGSMFF